MTQLDITGQDAATLETAPTRYIEGHRIRFAYRRLGPATGTPLVLLQHFSGNIDAWDPADALATDRPVTRMCKLRSPDDVSGRWKRVTGATRGTRPALS